MLNLKAQNAKRKVSAQNIKLLALSFSFALYTLHSMLSNASAQPISSAELIKNAKQYDGKMVTYEGEVIGDIMVRGSYAWVNIHDGTLALGAWMSSDAADKIAYTGSYKTKGDWVEVIGVFNRACPEHGGDLDIHVVSFRKIRSGRGIAERQNIEKRNSALILLGVLGGVWILTLLRRR